MLRYTKWDDDEPDDWGGGWDGDDDGEGDDEEDEDTVLCPYCKRPVHEDAQWCPHCENSISHEDVPPARKPWWILLGALACLSAIFLWITSP
jgi:hypothetical protein